MIKNQKIILTNNAYWPSIGGVENSLRQLAKSALDNGYEVKVVAGDIASTIDTIDTVKKEDGVALIHYPVQALKNAFLKPFNFFYSFYKLTQVFKTEYKNTPETTIIARFHLCALAAKLAGFKNVNYIVPSVIRFQSGIESQYSKSFISKCKTLAFISIHDYCQKKALEKSKNFVFSKTMLSQCLSISNTIQADYTLCKPGVDSTRFFPIEDNKALRQELGLPQSKKIILFVGRFVHAKGVDILIESMQHLSDDYLLVLVGDGQLKSQYEEKISDLYLDDRVKIFAPTRNVEIFYRCADVFAMTSRYEPLGQTILEALASGLRIVAFDNQTNVNTATKELDCEHYITYVNDFESSALAQGITHAINKSGHNKFDASSFTHNKFSWLNLLETCIK
ncbi:glycosyltransferase [Shewanella sp. A25]|nr:glycosyltransferase [Shewanella shenzhenensis]